MANERARELRRNATDAERVLWQQLRLLRERGFHFRRQAPIGKYIADFADFKSGTVIEVDGSQHLDSECDKTRDAWLASQGFRVMRFWNADVVTDLEGVTNTIHHALGLMEANSPDRPHPNPPHASRGRGKRGDRTLRGVEQSKPTFPLPRERSECGEGQGGGGESHASLPATGTLHTPTGPVATTWQVPEEIPVAILINSQSYAVMMATPADLEDFGVGFALAEGLVKTASHVKRVLVLPSHEGFACDLSIEDVHLNRDRLVKRSLEGRVGCGLCGIEDIEDAIRMPGGKVAEAPLDAEAVAKAYAELPEHQPMSAVNRTVHAAAWCDAAGNILLAREDVGRHNALDKLIGAMARDNIAPRNGFVLMSSRCSFELVQKCALAGIGALATVSAPTALALRLARDAGLKLAALSRNGVMIFDRD